MLVPSAVAFYWNFGGRGDPLPALFLYRIADPGALETLHPSVSILASFPFSFGELSYDLSEAISMTNRYFTSLLSIRS